MLECIVVGSGATGAMAAQTLVERGARVLMLDGGQVDRTYRSIVPDANFVDVRERDSQQYRYFLGDRFEAIAKAAVGTGSQLTPPRQHIVARVEEFLPWTSETIAPLESLALGGLASGWGLGCCVFSETELAAASLPPEEMHRAYQVVADRIGISGGEGDVRPYTIRGLASIQPSQPIDPTAGVLLQRYLRRRIALNERGFHVGRPALALLTEDRDGRRATRRDDMEFYSDAGQSAWRPWITINRLRETSLFEYHGETLVLGFEETEEGVRVRTLDIQTKAYREYLCRRLVLASGALGTARIMLRSVGKAGQRIPLLCNPYTYLPCIVPARVGRVTPRENISLCQLAMFYDRDGANADVAMGFVYTYRALMLFRVIQQAPLDFQSARLLMQYLMSGLLIVGVHHPNEHAASNTLELEADPTSPTGDRVVAHFSLGTQAAEKVHKAETQFIRALRTLGAFAIRRIHPGFGSSIHYAGTLPYGNPIFGLQPDGRTRPNSAVFVADGSGFTYLPAKGLTLSLMANAHRVAAGIPLGPA